MLQIVANKNGVGYLYAIFNWLNLKIDKSAL